MKEEGLITPNQTWIQWRLWMQSPLGEAGPEDQADSIGEDTQQSTECLQDQGYSYFFNKGFKDMKKK